MVVRECVYTYLVFNGEFLYDGWYKHCSLNNFFLGNRRVTLKLSWDIYDMRPQHLNEGETRDFYSENNKQRTRYNNE
jgi:hypothetical protein